VVSRLPGRRKRKGAVASPRERIQSAAAPLHDRRRRLVGARETTLRDLGGLMLEMYKRNRFREELLLDKCEEVLAIEVEIAHVDQRLFQLAPPNAAGMRPIGRCECGAPIHPGQNFCGVCGRSFATLTQSRTCARCGSGLRPGDQYCATCGSEAPDALQTIEASSSPGGLGAAPPLDAATIATNAVAETVIIEPAASTPAPPPLDGDPAAPSSPTAGAPAELPVDLPPPVDLASPIAEPAPAAEPASTPVDLPPPAAGASSPVDLPPPAVDVPSPVEVPVVGEPAPSDAPVEAPPAVAPDDTPPSFDWTTPPSAPDAAIDAALDASEPAESASGEAFAGLSLSSTVPPPPIVDPVDVTLPPPALPPVDAPAPGGAPIDAPPPVSAPIAIDAPPPAPGAIPAAAPAPASTKAARKAEAAAQKQKVKEAKARAKARAKAARAQRKRGGDA
jgi:hypothetical protein